MLGMWAWLMTELLLFAALFLVALIVRIQHPEATVEAARHLKFWIGATNTVVLIVSSLTMSMAIVLSRLGWQRGDGAGDAGDRRPRAACSSCSRATSITPITRST